MSFIGSVISVIFGLFWTIIAINMTASFPFGTVGLIMPLFGVAFIALGIINAVYHYKNATGKDRFSILDITDSTEEGDPAEKWVKKAIHEDTKSAEKINGNENGHLEFNYCPFCGRRLEDDYNYCPSCGKELHDS